MEEDFAHLWVRGRRCLLGSHWLCIQLQRWAAWLPRWCTLQQRAEEGRVSFERLPILPLRRVVPPRRRRLQARLKSRAPIRLRRSLPVPEQVPQVSRRAEEGSQITAVLRRATAAAVLG